MGAPAASTPAMGAPAMLPGDQLCTNAGAVRPVAFKLYSEVRIAVAVASLIAIDRCRRVEIVDDQIECATIVQVHIHGATRKATLAHAPRGRHVREVQVAIIAIDMIGDRHLRHLFQQREILLRYPLRKRRLYRRVTDEVDVVEIVRPTIDPARDEKIFLSVVVEIGEERRPAPVRRVHTGEISNLTEAALATIELQRVARVLRMVPGLQAEIEEIETLGVGRRLEHLFALRHHVGDNQVRTAVVVEVGRVDAHRETTGVFRRRGNCFGERAIAIVVIQEIVFLKVIGHVQINAAVAVEVACDHTKPKPFDAAKDAGLCTDVDIVAAIVAIHATTTQPTPDIAFERRANRALGVRRMTQQKQIEIAVVVVVEKRCLRRIANVIESRLPAAVGERAIAVVHVQHIATVHRQITHRRHINVDESIAIHVGHRHTRLPSFGPANFRAVGDILERVVPFVQIQRVPTNVRREVQILETVVVDIADRDTTTVVVVQVVENVEVRRFGNSVRKAHTG